MPAIKIFTGRHTEVPEGSSHYYECTLEDRDGPIQVAAVTAIVGWLDDNDTGTAINGKTAVDLLNANQGTLVDGGAGVAKFTWALDYDDALIVTVANTSEFHRITLKFTYARSGLPNGTLTHDGRSAGGNG